MSEQQRTEAEEESFEAMRARHEREMQMYDYNLYGQIVDQLTEFYGRSFDEAVKAAADYCDAEIEQAGDEKRDELNRDAEETAEEVASQQGWHRVDEEDEDEDDA